MIDKSIEFCLNISISQSSICLDVETEQSQWGWMIDDSWVFDDTSFSRAREEPLVFDCLSCARIPRLSNEILSSSRVIITKGVTPRIFLSTFLTKVPNLPKNLNWFSISITSKITILFFFPNFFTILYNFQNKTVKLVQGLCNYKISLLVAQGRLAYNFSPWCRTEMFDARLKNSTHPKFFIKKMILHIISTKSTTTSKLM